MLNLKFQKFNLFALFFLAFIPTLWAEVELYKKNDISLNFKFDGGLGAFSAFNTGFGSGSRETTNDNLATDRKWLEGYVKPSLEGEVSLKDKSAIYGKVSTIGAFTRGGGDGSLLSTTSNSPTGLDWEDLYLGWRSGENFIPIKDSSLDLSLGSQTTVLGDGFIIGDGTQDGYKRAAYYIGPRTAFRKTALFKGTIKPFRSNIFYLKNNSNQKWSRGNDQPTTSLYGINFEWFKEVEKKDDPDLWKVGAMLFRIFDADQSLDADKLNMTGRRDGLAVYNLWAGGSFIPHYPDILFSTSYVWQKNNHSERLVRANAWYVEPGYKFSFLPWSPLIWYRYAEFSGDGDANSRTKTSYDPLFFASGLKNTIGTWVLGEVYGQYIGTNSNLRVNQFHLGFTPTEDLCFGALFYRFNFKEPAQINVQSSRMMDEINLYVQWSPLKWLTMTATGGMGIPKQGLRDQMLTTDGGSLGRPVNKRFYVANLYFTVTF